MNNDSVELDSLIKSDNKQNQKQSRGFRNSGNRGGARRGGADRGRNRNFNNFNRNSGGSSGNRRGGYNQRQDRGKRGGFGGKPQKRVYKVKIENLHYSVDDNALEKAFGRIGEFKKCKVEWDASGRSNESGYIEYFNIEDAERAVSEFNQTKFEGQIISVSLEENSNTQQNNNKFSQQPDRINRRQGFKRRY
ncbi:hypothetical protein PPERSA_09927 [Pseudocohnilembus persalinus]|uniref:RRM domain-containing protein n=1 Tax=Pseudocohnilembus persalinus TaxID=266149 RepID=A0A0V0QJE8_PSEPJ|nr:hypothetical protein PPERSA_09927 [Pseudocohnilembus persalinus]|eukprot:KRX02310.1 hypothetical protein PPERSA_09927 [Pseudocohnilembus persalinus]